MKLNNEFATVTERVIQRDKLLKIAFFFITQYKRVFERWVQKVLQLVGFRNYIQGYYFYNNSFIN